MSRSRPRPSLGARPSGKRARRRAVADQAAGRRGRGAPGRRSRQRRPACAGRSAAPQAGAHQPALQRRQVQPRRRQGTRALRQIGRRVHRRGGRGHGSRDEHPAGGQALRAVRPAGRGGQRHRRHGPRPLPLQGAGACDGRHDHGRVSARCGHDDARPTARGRATARRGGRRRRGGARRAGAGARTADDRLHRGQPLPPEARGAVARPRRRRTADPGDAGNPRAGARPPAPTGPDPARPPSPRPARPAGARAAQARPRHRGDPGRDPERGRHPGTVRAPARPTRTAISPSRSTPRRCWRRFAERGRHEPAGSPRDRDPIRRSVLRRRSPLPGAVARRGIPDRGGNRAPPAAGAGAGSRCPPPRR